MVQQDEREHRDPDRNPGRHDDDRVQAGAEPAHPSPAIGRRPFLADAIERARPGIEPVGLGTQRATDFIDELVVSQHDVTGPSEFFGGVAASLNAPRKAFRARLVWVLTVPSDAPIAAAVSATERSAKNLSTTTSRWRAGSRRTALASAILSTSASEPSLALSPPFVERVQRRFGHSAAEVAAAIVQQIDQHAVRIGVRRIARHIPSPDHAHHHTLQKILGEVSVAREQIRAAQQRRGPASHEVVKGGLKRHADRSVPHIDP